MSGILIVKRMSIFMQCSLHTSHFKPQEILSYFLTDKTLKDPYIFGVFIKLLSIM